MVEDLPLPELEHPAERPQLREVLPLEERAPPGAQRRAGVLGRSRPMPAAGVLLEQIRLAERGVAPREEIGLGPLAGARALPGPRDELALAARPILRVLPLD